MSNKGNGAAEKPTCANCFFSVFQINNPQLLDCRNKPPALFMVASPHGVKFVTEFPKLQRNQWCGEHRKRSPLQDALPTLKEGGGETMPIPQIIKKGPPPDESIEG